jgi:hypothetical protein
VVSAVDSLSLQPTQHEAAFATNYGIVSTFDAAASQYAPMSQGDGMLFGDVYDPLIMNMPWNLGPPVDQYPEVPIPDLGPVSHALECPKDNGPVQFRFVHASGNGLYFHDDGLSSGTDAKIQSGTRQTNSEDPPEEWTTRRKKRAQSARLVHAPSPLVAADPGRNNQAPGPGSKADFSHLIHYDTCIRTMYTLKDDAKWDYHSFILGFIQKCQPDFPFRMAVLAWAARHSASDLRSEDLSWSLYYGKASSELSGLMAQGPSYARDPATQIAKRPAVSNTSEIILCTALFLCRCDVLSNNFVSLRARLCSVRDWLQVQPADWRISPFASKMLLWLAYLHVRVAIFVPDALDGTTILDSLVVRRDHRDIVFRAQEYLSDCFDAVPGQQSDFAASAAQDKEELYPISSLLHEIFVLLSNILRYRAWTRARSPSFADLHLSQARQEAVFADIARIAAEFELAVHTSPSAQILKLSPSLVGLAGGSDAVLDADALFGIEALGGVTRAMMHWLTCYAAFQVCKMLWSRILNPFARTDVESQAAVDDVLHIALRLRRARCGAAVRGLMWPLPLFVAAVETTDDVYADWLGGFIADASRGMKGDGGSGAKGRGRGGKGTMGFGGGCGMAAKAGKVQELMAVVREGQDREGKRVDVEDVVRETQPEGANLIF